MTKLKTRLPIKALAVLLAIMMIFSTMSIMFTVSAALSEEEGGGNGVWYDSMLNKTLSITGEYLSSSGTLNSTARSYNVHYAVYMPEGYEDNYAEYRANGKQLATMLVFSGGSSTLNAGDSSYSAMARVTGLNYLADKQGIVLIYLRMSNTSLNPNYYWNFFLDTYQERSTSRPLGQICTMVESVKTTLNTDFSDIITQDGKKRTYVAGFSAGACLASNMIAVYPDEFEGAAIVAGMPYRMFRSTTSGYTYGGYANAMYGGDGSTKNYDSWSSYGYSWNRQSIATYGGHLSTAWKASGTGISDPATDPDTPRIIVLHGAVDNVVDLRNGEQNASAIAYAMGLTNTTGSGVNQRVVYPNSETKDGYTAYYYGLNDTTFMGNISTTVGYSKARASRLAFMTFDGVGHKWIAEHAQPLESGNESNSSAMGGSDPRYDYNDIIWDFFEGEPSYYEADPVEPEGEAINPTYGARFGLENGVKFADIVTAQGLTLTESPLSPKYLQADTYPESGTEWNFNFDLTSLINKESAFVTDPRYKLTVESITVYQNVWVSEDGITVNMGYDVIDSASISQGGSNAVALDGVTELTDWTGTPKFQTAQFVKQIPVSDELSDELIEKKVLSIVNYGEKAGVANADYNVAAPVIVITFGQMLKDTMAEVPGDGATKTSVKLFPVFAYNSAAGYNAPDSAANETKTYEDMQGHLIGTAKKYAVGVYNASDSNDKIYYSYDLQDYTILNNNTIKSITIDFAIEGNPYYSKEDVGVKVMAIGNMHWDAAGEQPTDYITLPESYTLAKGERLEGQIVIDQKGIINRVTNLGGFTLVFENTAQNEHYYFLITMPTITVNYEHIPGTEVKELSGVGSRTELGYDDLVSDDNLYEKGETTFEDTYSVGSVTVSNPKYASSTNAESGNSTASTGSSNRYRTSFGAYQVYSDAIEQNIIDSIKEKFPGMTEGVDYWITLSDIKLVSANVAMHAAKSSSSYRNTAYGYVYYYPTAQSDSTSAFATADGDGPILTVDITSNNTNAVNGDVDYTFNMDVSKDASYLWLKSYGSTSGNYYVNTSVPTLTDVKLSYKATVSLEEPKEDDGGDDDDPIPTYTPNDGYVNVTLGDDAKGGADAPLTLTPSSGRFTTSTSYAESNATNRWTNISSWTTSYSALYGLILNYDIYSYYSQLAAYTDALAKYEAQYPASQGYRVSGSLTNTLTLTGTAAGATEKSFYAIAGNTEWAVYDSSMKQGVVFKSDASTSYTATLTDFPEITESNPILTIYYGSTTAGTNYRISNIPTATYNYSYEIIVERLADPILSATAVTNATDRTVTITVVTTGPFDSIRIAGVDYTESYVNVDGNREYTVTIAAPEANTTYTISAAKSGVTDSRTKDVSVTGVGAPDEPVEQDVIMDAAGNTLTGVVNGDSYQVPDNYYDETRTTTSTSSKPVNKNLFPVNGYIVGTNSKYYTNNSDDYWTGPNRSTGSPQANVALDTTKTSFPVSYLGYAYMNYDVSEYFDLEEPKTLISDNSANPEVTEDEATGVKTSVITKVYEETVVSGIRINTIKAQEGYTGGWANRYAIDGNAFVKAGNEWTSTTKPSNVQGLGEGSVTSTMGTIGTAANLSAGQLDAAREDGFVTIWVNNTGCDWSSRYYPSAWLLVEMPTITVTYKTITYTEKIITETKKVTQATESTYTEPTTTTTTTTSDIQNGYLYGAEGMGTTNYQQTYSGMWNSTPSNDTGEHYYTTSSGSNSYPTYRTATTDSTSYFMAQANVEMNSTSLSGGKFAVTYMGSGIAEYNLSSLLNESVQSKVTSSETTTGVINGKSTEVIKETIQHTQNKVKSITFSITTQAGFTGNSNAANDYNVTNVFYMGVFDDWSGTNYPSSTDAGWTTIATVSNIQISSKTTNVTISAEDNSDVYNALLQNGYLTVRVDNTYNDWDESYKGCAWTLITIGDVTVSYESTTWTETKLTATEATDTFKPTYEVYAQYRFTGTNGESYSKTKYLGVMDGYGAEGTITPYVVAPGATHGTINALFSSPVGANDKPTNSVLITNKESDTESYKLKRAYVEQTGQDIATLSDNGNDTYLLATTLTSDMLKTNDTYKIRVIFEYESEAETQIPESELIKVNLHAVFENYDANGNFLETVGQIDTLNFAQLTDLSYVLSLDDAEIPFGDYTINGTPVSAIAGSNRIYTLDVGRTEVRLAQSTTTTQTGTYEFASSTKYEAKTYLDITGGAPALGDILVVTYNGAENAENSAIDVYLYYKATPQYDVTVNYEFDIVNTRGESITTQNYTYSELFEMSIGDVIFPYDALSTEEVDRTSVSLQINGESEASTYKVNQFGEPTITASSGIEYDEDTLVITDITADGTINFKYQLVVNTDTEVEVNHKYVVKYNGEVIGESSLDHTIANLTAPNGGSIALKLDDTMVQFLNVGDYASSLFTPVRIEAGDSGLEFAEYTGNGVFTPTKVPFNTPNATVTVVYELEVNKIVVIEKFSQNGEVAGDQQTTTVYAPVGSAYVFDSIFEPDYQPFDDGVTFDQYKATSSDVTLTNTTGGYTTFTIDPVNADREITIVYDYASYAQVPINIVHSFYKNGQLVGTLTDSTVILTNDPEGTSYYVVTPLSGTVTGISGSISSAIVDANNYYANGMSSADADVSVEGYKVTYINDEATGSQDAIDVIVRYDITDTASVMVNHEFYINGVKVDATITNAPTSSLTLTTGVAQSIPVLAQGTVAYYGGSSFDISKFTATVVDSDVIDGNGTNATLKLYNVADNTVTVTVRYDLTVREITVKEYFKNSTGTMGTETSTLYVADGDSYTFTSSYNAYNGIAISYFSKTISDGYALGAGDVATFTSTAAGDTTVEITYTVGTQADVTVNHEFYINGNPVDADYTNATENLVLNYGSAQAINKAQGTVNYNGTEFNLSDFATSATSTNGITVNGLSATLTEYNVAEGTVTVRYDLTVYTINVTETFVKDGDTVASAAKTAYIKAGDSYTFTSDYNAGSVIADVALGNYIRTAEGATVTTDANGAATFTANADATVAINYAVSTKSIANVEYVYIVNGAQVNASDFTGFTAGDSSMNLVYGVDVSAPSANGTYTLGNDSYTLASDFTKTVTVNGAAVANGNNVMLNAYNVADNTITVTVTYEITISNEADVNVFHTYYINGEELTGSALAEVVTGTTAITLQYGVTQTIQASTGTVNYNGTLFNVSDFDVTVEGYDANILSINGLDATLIRHNVGAQNVTLRYDLTVYTVVVNENFYINGVAQTDSNVTNTYYVSANFAKLYANLVSDSATVNGIEVGKFITTATDNSDAIEGSITPDNRYTATVVNGSGIVTVDYNISTLTSVNVTSKFLINGSAEGIDTSNVTNLTSVQTGFEYGVSKQLALAGGYVIWNGIQLNVVDFTAAITNYDVEVASANGLNLTVNKYNTAATDVEITYNITVTTTANATVTHKYYFNGEEITPSITSQGATTLALTYGEPTSITLTQGTHIFNGTEFNLSDADITVTATPDIIDVDGANVTLNTLNVTETAITVRYDLSTVVVNIIEKVITDEGHEAIIADNKFYLLDNEVFSSYTTQFSSVVVNGVTVTYNDCSNKVVTGADGFSVVDTGSGFVITGQNAGQDATIVITYSGVKTTANVKISQKYTYKVNAIESYTLQTFTNTADGLGLSVGDKLQILGDRDLSLTVNGATFDVNTRYFNLTSVTASGLEGYVDEDGYFVITALSPNLTSQVNVTLTYAINVYSDVEVSHEFYVNGNLVNDATITEKLTGVTITSAVSNSYVGKLKIAQKTSGTIVANGKTYNIKDFIVDDSLIQTTGLTIKRSQATNYTNNFAVLSFDYSTDERKVVIRYDILSTLEEADVTVNSTYVNNGEVVGTISNSTVTNLKIGDVIANETVKTINGIEVTFTVQSVTANGITITEENGVYTIAEIDPRAAEWTIDITYVASATAYVTVTHNFYVAGELLGTITGNTVLVNIADHSGKFVALNGIVGVTTSKGVVYVDANRFIVSLASGSEYGTFANDVFTLNASAFNGSTYEIVFDYEVDGITYAIDGEAGIKQNATSTNVDGQYNVITTITSVGNYRPIDLIFVVDVSEGMGDVSNAKLDNAKAEISEYITNSFAVNNNVRVAIITYADGYEILAGGYITDKDTALATVAGITLAEAKDGYDVTASNLQAGLYGARMLMNSDVRRAYTDVIVIKGSEANAAYSPYNSSYNYSVKVDATADEANAAADYELSKMNASKTTVIDLTNAETDIDATMTEIFDARNYINVKGEVYITINADEFTFVQANGVTVNGVPVEYTYREKDGLISIKNFGTLKGTAQIEYTVELINKVDGDYFVSDEIKIAYIDTIDNAREIVYGTSARVSYSSTVTGATITVITYLANSKLNPVGMDGLTVKNFYEDAIIGKPVVYAVSGVTNLTAGTTYDVKAPIVSGYTLWDNEESVKTIEIPAEGENAVVYFGYYASGALVDDSIVYDDASEIVFDVLANDTRPTGESFNVIYGIGATEDEARNGNQEKVSASYGELIIIDGGKVRYSPNGITVTGKFYYAVQDGDSICVGVIYIVPATIVKADVTTEAQVQIGDRWTVVHEVNNLETEVSADKSITDYNPNTNGGLPTNNANTSGNLVAGKEYTMSVDPANAGDGSYYYVNGNLTDGVKGGTSNNQYLGWFGITNEVVFDLGITHKLTSVVVSYLTYEANAIRTPQFTLSVSDDGVNYKVYKVYNIANEANNYRTAHELELEIDSAVAGRYVKITTTPDYLGWVFMSEIELYGSKDLALGADYTTNSDGSIYASTTTPGNYDDKDEDGDGTMDRLTNGNKDTGDVDNNGVVNETKVDYKGDYIRWVNASYVEVVVDLGAVMMTGKYAVHSAANFWGYTPIQNVEVLVSTDGNTFTPVYGQYHIQELVKYGEETFDEDEVTKIKSEVYVDYVSSGKLVAARYVMFRITPCEVFGFAGIDEVEVSGELLYDYELTNENLLSGKDYTSSTGSDRVSTDSDGINYSDLTDGIAYRTSGTAGHWFGLRSDAFEGTDANVIDDRAEMIFDLGGVYDLTSAKIHFRNVTPVSGVVPPKSVKIWVSVDGETYNRYVTLKTDATEDVCYWSVAENISGLVGRYVKVEIEMNSDKSNGGGGWVYLNEIEVYGNKASSYISSDKVSNDANDIYGGYEDDYKNNFWFDGNDALYANRYQDYINNGKVDGTDAQYTATFTFTGTGFDIISVTGRAGGYVTIKTWDSNGNLVKNASGSITTFANTDNIYQATIFTCTDLTLDTYRVEIIAQRTLQSFIGMTDTQVYIDSVRTYNPFENNTNEHYNDIQDGAKTESLKDIFVDGNLAVSTGGNGLFTQSGMLDINSYMNKATNNAINIIAGQSLLFKLDNASANTSFQVEMAAVSGSATAADGNNNAIVEVYVNSKLVETLTIDTGVFAYYDFSKYIREDSTVNFKVIEGQATFSKVRYNDAVLGEPEGEKYTTAGLATQSTPDGELKSDAYTVNTGRLVKKTGTSRTITALVYTSTNADSVIIYTNGYRIAPTSVTVKANSAGAQNQFMVTYTLPDDIPVGEVEIEFYAYDTASNTYSSNYKTATYTLK